MVKVCSRCGSSKAHSEFVRSTVTSNGVGAHCLLCERERVRARRANPEVRHKEHGAVPHPHRQRYYAKIDALKGGACCDCGGRFPPDAMDFDHVRGTKVASIAQMRSRAWEHVLIELAKCELVCANCHRIRTWQRKQATKRAA